MPLRARKQYVNNAQATAALYNSVGWGPTGYAQAEIITHPNDIYTRVPPRRNFGNRKWAGMQQNVPDFTVQTSARIAMNVPNPWQAVRVGQRTTVQKNNMAWQGLYPTGPATIAEYQQTAQQTQQGGNLLSVLKSRWMVG